MNVPAVDYSLGLELTIWIAGVVSAILSLGLLGLLALAVFAIAKGTYSGTDKSVPLGARYFLVPVIFVIPVLAYLVVASLIVACVFLLVFGVAYPIINQIFIGLPSLEQLKSEIGHGSLGLRIVTIMISWNAIRRIPLSFLGRKVKPLGWYEKSSDLERLSPRSDILISYLGFFQNSFYLGVILVMWLFLIYGLGDARTAIINWALFFIADDWIIISDYLVILKGRVLWVHSFRIILSNFLFVWLVPRAISDAWGPVPGFFALLLLATLAIINTSSLFAAARFSS